MKQLNMKGTKPKRWKILLQPQSFVNGVFYEIRYQFKTAGKEILHFLLKSGSDIRDIRDHAGDIFFSRQ